jgi:hypothetical protein
MDLKNRIFDLLNAGKDVFLVGKSDSGKTYFAKNELIPFLKSKGLEVRYFQNCEEVVSMKGVAIVDEVESFQDLDFLEKEHPEEAPYYTDDYINKVNHWFENLRNLNEPAIFLVTRPGEKEVEHFAQKIKTSDWSGRPAEALVFQID